MKELISESINWDNLGNHEKSEYILELGTARLGRDNGILTIPVSLNFVVPFIDQERIKALIINKLPQVKRVEFEYTYHDVILTDKEIIRLYVPHIIDETRSELGGITNCIEAERFNVKDGRLNIFVLTNFSEECLNDKGKRLFESKLKQFGLNYDVTFIVDNEEKEKVEKRFEETEEKDLRESVDKQKRELLEQAKMRPKTSESSYSADGNSEGKTQWRRKEKEIPAEGNRIMGRGIAGDKNCELQDIDPSLGTVIVEGVLFKKEARIIKSGNYLVTLLITDNKTTTICTKAFCSKTKWGEIDSLLNSGDSIKLRGQVQWDTHENMNTIMFKELEKTDSIQGRLDTFDGGRRVELHIHSKMSKMDGLNEPSEIVKQAALWGHKAVAITDHGVVQSFPDCRAEALNQRDKGRPIKVIFGVEGYVFDDSDCTNEDGTIDYKAKPVNHIIILAKNQEGLKNIYRLVSASHLDYFYKKPRLPWSVIEKNREGLIIGSACCYGEVFMSIVSHVSHNKRTGAEKRRDALSLEEQLKIAGRYDYLEIQPVVNNRFMLSDEYYFNDKRVENDDDIREINKYIISLADKLGKKTVATTDSHYKEPGDAIYRNILMSGMGFEDAESGEGLYMKTTDEMMAEFSYLGDRAEEIVIRNTNEIADMVDDDILPVPERKFPPKIKGAEETLRSTCMERAYSQYGNPLPEEVKARLDKELNSIIDNGYAVMYVSAQMLVQKSLSDGYLVGSRGSVGSSFAATMAGITEVNPLDPHYLCPKCKHLEWGDMSKYDCGVDMPPKECPECGTPMTRDGYTIPFATFLGFNGDKEPDIDLNFAGEYQPVAHRYVGEIFGEKNVFKAGTVGTVAEKTAYGYVRHYFEDMGVPINKYEADRLTVGCTGVKRTTGQHPGGIVICPDDHEIYEFCPIQHPADDADSDIVTTHFDYHKIDQNLLKLDILGHDVPSMIRQLQDMTGIDPLTLDLTDRKVLSIFNGTEALDIKDENYRFVHGSYAIPEFGTSFTRKMLDDIHPDKFADLVRISGFSHGTDVWRNNAQDYIRSGTATMSEVISTRDDIMNYLMLKGVDNSKAFKIMEIVRKGKKDLDEDQVKTMKEHGVPDWYIDSCNKIKYMFPRAHAVAYTMMSFRMAWFKVYYPVEFYATWFTTKVADFDEETILKGKNAVLEKMDLIDSKGKEASAKETDQYTVLEVAYEMYARGYEFMPVTLGKSEAEKFRIEEGKVLVPFNAIDGVGDSAAVSFVNAYNDRPFETIEDAVKRSKINSSAVEKLKARNVFDGLQETDQFSMF